ncbi:MAG: hypothetical protein U9O78_02485 [Patescibacteria group bacterium]|nr:hypothetical protein [Patescibacteria group bacterium]
MIAIQRALISAVVYAVKNEKFTNSRTVSIRSLQVSSLRMAFSGKWTEEKIDVYERKYYYNFESTSLSKSPYKIMIKCGSPLDDRIELEIPTNSSRFTGRSSQSGYFEGDYTRPGTKVRIRDSGSKKYNYAYEVNW